MCPCSWVHEHGHMSPSVWTPPSKSWEGGPVLFSPNCEMNRKHILSLPSLNTQRTKQACSVATTTRVKEQGREDRGAGRLEGWKWVLSVVCL